MSIPKLFLRFQKIDRKILNVSIAGILLRLVFMVSSCHFDLISNYWYGHFLAYHQGIPSGLKGGIVYFWPMIYIHGTWLFLIRNFMNKGMDLWPEHLFSGGNPFIVNIDAWQHFVSQPNIFSILFLLKLPYLIAELLMITLIYKMFSSPETKYKVLKFLVFNPVSLFIIYIFGAYDILLVSFLVLSLYLIKKQKIYLGMLSLGLSIFIKFYNLFLLPLFVLIISREWSRRIRLLIWGALPVLISAIVVFFKGELGESLGRGVSSPLSGYIFSMVSPFQYLSDRIYPLFLAYFFILFYITYNSQKYNVFEELCKYSLVLALLFYSLCFFHPQYFLLVVPFIALQIDKVKRVVPLFFLQAFCFFIYTFQWGSDLSWRLFMPINPQFFANIKSPIDAIAQFYPVERFIGIFRSLFVAVSFWMVYLLMKKDKDLSAGYVR